MRGHNICFRCEIKKISLNYPHSPLIWSSAFVSEYIILELDDILDIQPDIH